jgi:hypothetical protein
MIGATCGVSNSHFAYSKIRSFGVISLSKENGPDCGAISSLYIGFIM